MTHSHDRNVRNPVASASRRRGFTLVELLITMSVIIIISGFVITAVGGNDGTNELNSAISRADSVFSLARSAAISRKTPVRVMVNYDPSRGGRNGEFLRYMIVYYLDRDDAAGPRWKPFAEGEYLPQGIFVDVSRMTTNDGRYRVWTSPVNSQSIINDYAEIPEPSASSLPELPTNTTPNNNQWIVYEFHANGTARHPMSRLVLGRALQAEPNSPLNVIPNQYMRAGFVLFRSGKVVHFQSPEHLWGAIN
ncbi:MAG: prepilin-type N-terminal cleavage/methylation domain-containing protein [Verrucomicrobia bacterium]|nr:prepilin-type N-terminal cleavage/methylation domain-containing protein [Verrucomicrobiota bacterium]MCH8527935.1 prepilin-type N-terminal cleavage/methylation domain-containing protein [Kiritimatiellia bacterium]